MKSEHVEVWWWGWRSLSLFVLAARLLCSCLCHTVNHCFVILPTRHTCWNVLQTRGVYYSCSPGKETIENVQRGVTSSLPAEPLGRSVTHIVGARGDTTCITALWWAAMHCLSELLQKATVEQRDVLFCAFQMWKCFLVLIKTLSLQHPCCDYSQVCHN